MTTTARYNLTRFALVSRVNLMRLSVLCLEDRLAPAAGDLDPTFNGTGINTALAEPSFSPSDVALAQDGDVLVYGTQSDPNARPGQASGPVAVVVRLGPDGRPDPAFGSGGRAVLPAGTPTSRAGRLVVLTDGSLLTTVVEPRSFTSVSEVLRVSADGASATRVGTGGANGVAVNPATGDVYLLDTANIDFLTDGPPLPDVVVTRLDRELKPVGSVTIDISGGADLATSLALDAAGRVYVVASSAYVWDTPLRVARVDGDLNPASVLKATYEVGAFFASAGVAVGPTGQVFVAGAMTNASPQSVVLRLDPTLREQARTTVSHVDPRSFGRNVAIDPAGRVVVAGSASDTETRTDVAVARLNPVTLAPDTTFAGTGRKVIDLGADDHAAAVAIDPAGRIVVTATATTIGIPNPSVTGAVMRLVGSSSPPISLLVGGPADGTALGLTASGGKYAAETPVAMFGGDAVSIRPATADVTGDGVPDIIGGTGPGAAARVTLIDGATRQIIAILNPFEPSFTGGVFVAAADVDGDGMADVVVTPDRGGGPVVAVYSGAKLAAGQDDAQIARFFGIEDPNFRGGARPAAGDINGDGKADVVVAAGFLGGPRVAVFDGAGVAAGVETHPKLVADFFAFEETVRNGAFVAAGDVTGDGRADLAFGGGPGGSPRVRLFDGAKLLAAGPFATLDQIGGTQVANFFAGDESHRGGVRIALRDANNDGRAELHTGSGASEPSRLRVYDSGNLLPNANPSADQELDPYGASLPEGVFVG